MDISSFFLGLVFISSLIFYFLTKNRKKSELYHYASKLEGPFALPLIGSCYYLLGSNERVVQNILHLIRKFKAPWKIWLGSKLYIVITEPEDIEVVLNHALEKAVNYNFVKPVLEEGIFTAPVQKWRNHRRVISKTFGMPVLNSYVEIFAKCAQNVAVALEKYSGEDYFDVYVPMTRCVTEMECETIMGTISNDGSQHFDYPKNLSKAMEIIFMRIFQYWLNPDFIWCRSSYFTILERLSENLRIFIKKIVTQKREEFRLKKDDYCEGSKRTKCFLDHLIELSETTESWTNHELMEEAQTMVAAGNESLSSSISYTLIMIGMHPRVQEKISAEISSIFGTNDRNVTFEDLHKMIYLERVIQETLRLFPVAAAVGRLVNKNIITDRYTLPAGCECIVALLYTHRNEKIWPEPLKFDPDRFLPEEVAKRHPYSYLPFSAGPRKCIGFMYATMAMKTVIATIVKNYKISTDFKNVSDINFVPGVILKATKGYRVALERRDF